MDQGDAVRARVERDIAHALYTYINPICGGTLDALGTGWPFGRALNQGELYGVVHAVPGVEHVKLLRLYETDLASGEQQPQGPGVLSLLPPDSTTEHTLEADGVKLAYSATAGTLNLYEQSGERTAAIFYTAYVLKGGGPNRPVTFAFNGGPGAASAYLHLGLVGP